VLGSGEWLVRVRPLVLMGYSAETGRSRLVANAPQRVWEIARIMSNNLNDNPPHQLVVSLGLMAEELGELGRIHAVRPALEISRPSAFPQRREVTSAGSDQAGHSVKEEGNAAKFDVMEKFRVLTESAQQVGFGIQEKQGWPVNGLASSPPMK
jgi:hypothetical protein